MCKNMINYLYSIVYSIHVTYSICIIGVLLNDPSSMNDNLLLFKYSFCNFFKFSRLLFSMYCSLLYDKSLKNRITHACINYQIHDLLF